MAEKASWRVSKQTAQLDAARSAAKGLWQDSAGRHVDARYLRPHSQSAATMASELGSQERDLEAAGKSRLAATEHQKIAEREAHTVTEELAASEREVTLVYDFVTRSSSFENRAEAMQSQCEALAAQAGTACSGIAAEGGGSHQHPVADLVQTAEGHGALSGETSNSAVVEEAWRCGIQIQNGRAYFHPEDPEYKWWISVAKKVDAHPGEYSCMLHGNSREVAVGSKRLNAEELAALIRRDSSWAGQPVRLLSCNTGAEMNGIAQGVSASLGVSVKAPTAPVIVRYDGTVSLGSYEVRGDQYFPKSYGSWRQFDPRP